MGSLFCKIEFEPIQKTPDELANLQRYLEGYISSPEIRNKIKKYFLEKKNRAKLYEYIFKIDSDKNPHMEIQPSYEPQDYSIMMSIDNLNYKNFPLHLELYNIGYLLNNQGILYRIIIFYSFIQKILLGQENRTKEDQIKLITNTFKAIDNDDITYLKALTKLEINQKFFHFIKGGFNKINTWFNTDGSENDQIAKIFFRFVVKGISKIILKSFWGIVTLASGIGLCLLGFTAILFNHVENERININNYIKEKNFENLKKILEKITFIFKNEENEVLEFFRNNNIFALAFDSNKAIKKNVGAAFFGTFIKDLGKKAKKLIKDEKIGFSGDDENMMYDRYEKNIKEIINFFKKTKDNFQRLLTLNDSGNIEEINENNYHIKQIVKSLIKINNKALIEDNDIVSINNENESITEPLIKNNNNENLSSDQQSIQTNENELILEIKNEDKDEEKENLKNIIERLEKEKNYWKIEYERNIIIKEGELKKIKKERDDLQSQNENLKNSLFETKKENQNLKEMNNLGNQAYKSLLNQNNGLKEINNHGHQAYKILLNQNKELKEENEAFKLKQELNNIGNFKEKSTMINNRNLNSLSQIN